MLGCIGQITAAYRRAVPPKLRIYISIAANVFDCGSDLLLACTIGMDYTDSAVDNRRGTAASVLLVFAVLGIVSALVATLWIVSLKLKQLSDINKIDHLQVESMASASVSMRKMCKLSETGRLGPGTTESDATNVLYSELLELRAEANGKRASVISLVVEDFLFVGLNCWYIIAVTGTIDFVGGLAMATSILAILYKVRESWQLIEINAAFRKKEMALDMLLRTSRIRRASVLVMDEDARTGLHSTLRKAAHRVYLKQVKRGQRVLQKLREANAFYANADNLTLELEECKSKVASVRAAIRCLVEQFEAEGFW